VHELTVHIVDDDPAVLDSLSILLDSAGFMTKCYPSGQAFIDFYSYRISPGSSDCLVLDINMPGMSGLELQENLTALNIRIPTIIITGHGNIATAVQAMKNGAVDFIEKPYREKDIIESLDKILLSYSQTDELQLMINVFRVLFAHLTPREQQVYKELIKGHPNKTIAKGLGISFRTVEIHRSHILQKMQVKTLSELIRKSILSDIQ
jgi:two-component system response regulator FixJ